MPARHGYFHRPPHGGLTFDLGKITAGRIGPGDGKCGGAGKIDLANPKTNRKNAGFTDEERDRFDAIIEAGFIDSFRHLYPDTTQRYSWWSYRAAARKRNIGWRIDYFCVSDSLKASIQDATILYQVEGSDHCPVGLVVSAS